MKMTPAQKHQERKLRIRIKELASEAGHIRHEERQTAGEWKYFLQLHRKTVVRQGARKAQLAYAILRGTPYCEVERSVRDRGVFLYQILPDVKKTAARFGVPNDVIEAWVAEMNVYLDTGIVPAKKEPSADEGSLCHAVA
jgi:hypothetical protein